MVFADFVATLWTPTEEKRPALTLVTPETPTRCQFEDRDHRELPPAPSGAERFRPQPKLDTTGAKGRISPVGAFGAHFASGTARGTPRGHPRGSRAARARGVSWWASGLQIHPPWTFWAINLQGVGSSRLFPSNFGGSGRSIRRESAIVGYFCRWTLNAQSKFKI